MQDIRAIPTATMAIVSQILSSLAESVAKGVMLSEAALEVDVRGLAARGLPAKGVAAIAGEATLRVKNGAVNATNTPACLKRAAMWCIFPP
jgi:hypothetical protein